MAQCLVPRVVFARDRLAIASARAASVRGAAGPLQYTQRIKLRVLLPRASSNSSALRSKLICKCRLQLGAPLRVPTCMHPAHHKPATSLTRAGAASARRARHVCRRRRRGRLLPTAPRPPTSTSTACAQRPRAGRKTGAVRWRVAKGYGWRRSVRLRPYAPALHARAPRRKSSCWAWRARGVRLSATYGVLAQLEERLKTVLVRLGGRQLGC